MDLRVLTCWRVAAFVTGLCGLPFISLAQTNEGQPDAPTNHTVMSVDVRRDVAGTYMPYRYAFVTAGPEKYTFLVPEGYHVDSSDPAKIKLASPDFSVLIILGVTAGPSAPGAKMDAEALQAQVMANHPNAIIKESQTASANGQTVPALDYVWKTDTGVTRSSRTTYIATASGLMEFTLNASPEQFATGLPHLNLVMLTFRTGSNGKFDYVVGSKFP